MKPVVSVVLITYAQASFIEQAIQGVLSQQCSYPIEFIIANDASPDNTDALIRKLIKSEVPGISVKYICQEQNLGMAANYSHAIAQTTGTYLALCEGDDYWTEPLKLQKQINFLEKNPDYNSCFHDLDIFDDSKKKFKSYYQSDTQEQHFLNLNGKELAKTAAIGTCTYVCRNNLRAHVELLSKCGIVDYPTFILSTGLQKAAFLNEKMAVYRIHDGGIWSANTNWKNTQNLIETLILLIEYPAVDEALKPNLKENLYKSICSCAFLLLIEGNIKEGVEILKKYQVYDLNKYIVDNFLLELLEKMQSTKSYKLSKQISRVSKMFGVNG